MTLALEYLLLVVTLAGLATAAIFYRAERKALKPGNIYDETGRVIGSIRTEEQMRDEYRPFRRAYVPDTRVTFGKRTTPPPPLELSRRQLEAINTRRKLHGKQPLSLTGFRRAISVAPAKVYYHAQSQILTEPPATWLPYFLQYEEVSLGETSPTVAVESGITVTPGGGDYAGSTGPRSWDPVVVDAPLPGPDRGNGHL